MRASNRARTRAIRFWIATAFLSLSACVPGIGELPTTPGEDHRTFYRAPEFNRGAERYSAWFADSDGQILYFGLSPFWTLWWETGGNPRADLDQPGDHLIGRFNLAQRRFLRPLRVQPSGHESRSSVWDVLVHSNGRIYYTTYFEQMGWVSPDGEESQHFPDLGAGLNELVEGPQGRIYVTRYTNDPLDPGRNRFGSILVLTPEGARVQEFRFEPENGRLIAPKSLAVDPATGEIWLNADAFDAEGAVSHATLRLASDGTLLERRLGAPELHFVWFDREGIGWFAEDQNGELRLRAVRAGREVESFSLGPRAPLDFVQDLKPFSERGVVAALWSGRAFLASLEENGSVLKEIRFDRPGDCVSPEGRSVLYTAIAHGDRVYGTLFCGPTVVSAPIPPNAHVPDLR